MAFAPKYYVAYHNALGALTTDPGGLKSHYAGMGNDTTGGHPKAYALCKDMVGILAIGTTGKQ
jgi:hypothetical protein